MRGQNSCSGARKKFELDGVSRVVTAPSRPENEAQDSGTKIPVILNETTTHAFRNLGPGDFKADGNEGIAAVSRTRELESAMKAST